MLKSKIGQILEQMKEFRTKTNKRFDKVYKRFDKMNEDHKNFIHVVQVDLLSKSKKAP